MFLFRTLALATFVLTLGAAAVQAEESRTPQQILESYVEDFRADRFAREARLFGVEIPGVGEWHIRVTGEQAEETWGVELEEGPPPSPTFLYRVEEETLRMMDRGDLNPITAQGKAFPTDFAPMDAIEMEGWTPTAEETAAINPFSFHFWTRGFPEVIPFGPGLTREAHGSPFVGFYYETGLRTVYSRIAPGGRVRDDPREMALPFMMLIVAVEGTAEGEIDGVRVTLPMGNAVFVPPFSTHLWWNDTEEPAAAILIMFGDGA